MPEGHTPASRLRELTYAGAETRYPAGVPNKILRTLEHELALITALRYESFFLTIEDIVRFARGRGILCQGRGSAANSAVCYCLRITAVDPARMQTLFERFISKERNEPPDIDVDFEHQRPRKSCITLRALRPRPGGHRRHRHQLPAAECGARRRQGARLLARPSGKTQRRPGVVGRVQVRNDRLIEAGFDPENPTVRHLQALVERSSAFPATCRSTSAASSSTTQALQARADRKRR